MTKNYIPTLKMFPQYRLLNFWILQSITVPFSAGLLDGVLLTTIDLLSLFIFILSYSICMQKESIHSFFDMF